jgi:hypothetical protein
MQIIQTMNENPRLISWLQRTPSNKMKKMNMNMNMNMNMIPLDTHTINPGIIMIMHKYKQAEPDVHELADE